MQFSCDAIADAASRHRLKISRRLAKQIESRIGDAVGFLDLARKDLNWAKVDQAYDALMKLSKLIQGQTVDIVD